MSGKTHLLSRPSDLTLETLLANRRRLLPLVSAGLCLLTLSLTSQALPGIEFTLLSHAERPHQRHFIPTPPSQKSWLFTFLAHLFRTLLLVLPLLLVVLGLGCATRVYYTQLFTDSTSDPPIHDDSSIDESAVSRAVMTPQPSADNEIYRGWLQLMQQLETQHDVDVRTKTPAECVQLAIDNGWDREVVSELATSFIDIRYGTGTATDLDADHIRHLRNHLDLSTEARSQ